MPTWPAACAVAPGARQRSATNSPTRAHASCANALDRRRAVDVGDRDAVVGADEHVHRHDVAADGAHGGHRESAILRRWRSAPTPAARCPRPAAAATRRRPRRRPPARARRPAPTMRSCTPARRGARAGGVHQLVHARGTARRRPRTRPRRARRARSAGRRTTGKPTREGEVDGALGVEAAERAHVRARRRRPGRWRAAARGGRPAATPGGSARRRRGSPAAAARATRRAGASRRGDGARRSSTWPSSRSHGRGGDDLDAHAVGLDRAHQWRQAAGVLLRHDEDAGAGGGGAGRVMRRTRLEHDHAPTVRIARRRRAWNVRRLSAPRGHPPTGCAGGPAGEPAGPLRPTRSALDLEAYEARSGRRRRGRDR